LAIVRMSSMTSKSVHSKSLPVLTYETRDVLEMRVTSGERQVVAYCLRGDPDVVVWDDSPAPLKLGGNHAEAFGNSFIDWHKSVYIEECPQGGKVARLCRGVKRAVI